MATLLPSFDSLRCATVQLHNKITFFCCAIAQLHNRKKKATAAAVVFFFVTSCATQKNNKRRRQRYCRRLLSLCCLWSCTAKQLHKQTNKINEKKKVRCLPGSRSSSRVGPAPIPAAPLLQVRCSKLPCSKLAPARRLWSSSDGVRGGRGW
jgi:hypothetical protein